MWRKDECGAWIKRFHHAHRESELGWEIDYITAGGRDDLSNPRAVHWQNYVAGGVGHVVCKVTADPGGIKNKPGKRADRFALQRSDARRGREDLLRGLRMTFADDCRPADGLPLI